MTEEKKPVTTPTPRPTTVPSVEPGSDRPKTHQMPEPTYTPPPPPPPTPAESGRK